MYDKVEICQNHIEAPTKALFDAANENGVQMVVVTLIKRDVEVGENPSVDEQIVLSVCRGEGEMSNTLSLIAAIARGMVKPSEVVEGLEMLARFRKFEAMMLAAAPTAGNA